MGQIQETCICGKCAAVVWIDPHSRDLPAHKDENFVLRLHIFEEVQQVGLFLLCANNQDLLLH